MVASGGVELKEGVSLYNGPVLEGALDGAKFESAPSGVSGGVTISAFASSSSVVGS